MANITNWRHQYSDKDSAESRAATTIWEFEETTTVQDAPNSNLAEMLDRFGIKSGSILPAELGITDPSYYGDFTNVPDLRAALDEANNIEDRFLTLPAKIRDRFQNSPWKLAGFLQDPKNAEEAIFLGLLKRKAPEPILERKGTTPQTPETPS